MKLKHRLLYFSGGAVLGIIILFFILGGKKSSCAYGPQARTLKHLQIAPRSFSEESLMFFYKHNIDTASVEDILKNGKVDFSKSKTSRDACQVYYVDGVIQEKELQLEISFCDYVAEIENVFLRDDKND